MITILLRGFACFAASAVDHHYDASPKHQNQQQQKEEQYQDQQQQQRECEWSITTSSCVAESISEAWSNENVERTAIAWDLTQEEKLLLVALGQRLRDVNYYKNKPSEVVRFVQHWVRRNIDLDAAEAKFRNMVTWRLENDADSILLNYTPPTEMLEHLPGAVLKGLDKDGDPVFVSRLGATDGVGLLKRFGREALVKHAIWERENIWNGEWNQQYEEEQQRPVKHLLFIMDAQGLKLIRTILNRQLVDAFSELVRIDSANYPQGVKKCVIIRVPRIFEAVWKVIGSLLDPLNVQKTIFSSPNHYVKDLSELVDLEILPEEIVPGVGNGEARDGFPTSFKAGKVAIG